MTHRLTSLAVLLGGLASALAAQAQGSYTDDAVLYTRLGPAGTARTLGLAGANVALGADFASVSSNPAGLGLFTKSELTLTPGLGFGNSSATQQANSAYRGSGSVPSITNTSNSFHIANLGLVLASRLSDDDQSSDWRSGAFAVGLTRLADYNTAFRYRSTTDDEHSFFQFLREPGGTSDYGSARYQNALTGKGGVQEQYNNNQYTNLDGLAYAGYLTTPTRVPNPNNPSGQQVYQVQTKARPGTIQQDETVTNRGSLSQLDLGYGGNYRDRLYIGAGVGIVFSRRERTSSFMESSTRSNSLQEDFRYTDYVKTSGTGINARLGIIYRVVDAVRLGASIQTPTFISLQDTYTTTLVAASPYYVPANESNSFTTVPGTYDYSVTTPFRASGGIAVLLSKYAFLTGDVEYVGYRNASFSSYDGTSDDFVGTNSDIRAGLRKTVNLRFGAEGRFDAFRVRAGYARYGSPYAGSSAINRDQNYLTGGLGIRTSSYFLDAAGVYLTGQDLYSPYTLDPYNTATRGVAPVIAIDQNRFTVSITGGLLF